MKRRLLINGRFIGGDRTAVNNVARALTHSICMNDGGWTVEVVIPPAFKGLPMPMAWNVRTIGSHKGILWEQRDLPKLRHEGVIAGFFNTVPIRGRGYVTMLHDAHVFSAPGSYRTAQRLWRQTLSRCAGRAGNHLLTVSDHSKQDILRHRIGSAEDIGVVPNGPGQITQVTPDPSILERLDLRAGPFCVALATLMPHKNIEVLLRAFAQPNLAGIKLVLFGKADRNAFEGAGHAVPPNVIFAGFVRDAELAALYRDALAVCVPSTAEGFGLPALEAMALARPAIVAPCGALPEVVGDTGLMAAPDDPTAWAEAILQLNADKDLQHRLAKAAQARAASYTWDAAGQAVLGHLERWFPA